MLFFLVFRAFRGQSLLNFTGFRQNYELRDVLSDLQFFHFVSKTAPVKFQSGNRRGFV